MLDKVRKWLGEHVVLVDTISVAPFLSLAVGSYLGAIAADPSNTSLLRVAFAVALLLPLVLRRTLPMTVFTVIAVVAAMQMVSPVGLIVADLALLVALYTVAARGDPVRAVAALVMVEAGFLVALLRSEYVGWDDWDTFALYTCLILLFWVVGLYVKARRRHFAGLEERTRWLERERDARARVAVAEERERIAREMHDVVAHNLSVMVVQAEGATYAIDQDPARAKNALGTIAATGRSALAEVREILGVLREGGDEEEYAPRPGLEQVEQVVERVREAGLPVEFTVDGPRRGLSAGVELAAYRVVQEALTNTLRHAGPEVGRVLVRVRYGEDALELSVRDDGRGGGSVAEVEPEVEPEAGSEAGSGAVDGDGGGHGLIGMRERVSVYGGSVRAGPRADGGFEVVASLPLRSDTG
ncbi:sensor histidine kinase [Nocardiopsis sp. JB363]|uniref:sensor histidine kinase n=1 Tax=Nocardiopsis sp. JB363 TaxID=1434837 RepID=UPI001F338F7E|nr:histidine kinase [Nocardiopsis sp. JB363]